VTKSTRGERGQSTVELALLLPLVALLALLVVQVALVAQRQLHVVHLAREAARAAAVSDGDRVAAAHQAVARSVEAATDRFSVDAAVIGDRIEVRVGYREPTDVALVGVLLPSLELAGRTTMAIEAG
jgi:hypothetical protein